MANDLTPQRWLKIKELFHAALDLEANERRAFLDQACAGDEETRQEVESLLAQHEQPYSLIDRPAFEVAAELIATEQFPAEVRQAIGPYNIISQIGRGGMGEVYLAQDTRLGRRVALKLLPSRFTSDSDRLRRFKQEARAASALNHPNIITIHEVGQVDDAHFMATEYVEGQTLRSSIEGGAIKPAEAIDVAIQVASALRAAHEAGIVHRDIKPENIMVRPDGYVKVLDFGLAKLVERKAMTGDSGTSFSAVDTNPGIVMGTVSYMSPEQARGLATDARTDIFSLGVVLYEMVAGRAPFEGDTVSDIIVAILEKEPPPLSAYSNEAHEELQAIIDRALQKKKEERYQTAREILVELRKLKQDLELQARIESGSVEELLAGTRTRASGEQASTGSARAVTATNVAHITGIIKLHKRRVMVAVTALLIASAIAGVLLLAMPSKTIDSIAVLPFANATNDPNAEYLPDGVTESLINSLSLLPGLKVMARGTVFTYKGREVDPREIGEDLEVEAVVLGKILQKGQMITITAELVDTSDGSQLWGKQYNSTTSEILAVQQSISQEITARLRLGLSGEEQNRSAKGYTGNSEAYELYIKGRHYSERFTLEGFNKGAAYFNQAIEKDPNYALAYAGLAYDYYSASSTHLSPNEAWLKAKVAAKKAVELDESLPEAHVSLGIVLSQFERDWSGSEKELKRAIELNPNSAAAHQHYAWMLTLVGRFDEAEVEFKRAQQLDPFSSVMNVLLQWRFWLEHRYDQVIDNCLSALELEPNFYLFYLNMALAYEQQGKFAEAVAVLQKAKSLDDSTSIPGVLGHVYALSGRKDDARKVLDELKEQSKHRWVSPVLVGLIHLEIGEEDEAFVWFERAYETRDEWMLGLKNDPRFDSIRSDPQFQNLLQRMGLK